MNRRLLLMVVGGVAVGAMAWWTYERNAAAPLRQLRAEIASTSAALDDATDTVRAVRTVRDQLRLAADTALGDNAEQVVHALRVALNTIARDAGLTEIAVDSRDIGPVRSPAERSRTFRDAEGREAPDFHLVEGSLRATTTLDVALAVLAQVQSQPWPKQVESVSFSPREDGKLVELIVRLRTAFLPGLKSSPHPIEAARAEWTGAAAVIASGAIFTPWEPPAVAAAPAPPPDPGPSPERKPAWDQWSVTGLVNGREGQELLLVNSKSGERRTLKPGQEWLGLIFEGLRDDSAMIRAEEGVFALRPGQNLSQRDTPINDL